MSKTITSGNVTFVDLSDNRRLDAYISSNLPTTQIFNQNNQTYIPDWSKTNLQLNADIYLDSKKVTADAKTSIVWYKKDSTQSKIQVGTGASLIINSNQLTNDIGMITYICEATYNDTTINPPSAYAEMVFTRIDTGLNGSAGKDGTSVTILGSYNTVVELQSAHPTGNAGDAYIVDGDLYVWAVDDSQWKNVGNIQGPKGDQGESAKAIILNANTQVFKVDKENALSPTSITVTAYTFNTTVDSWAYSVDGGQTFLSTAPTGVSRSDNTVIISGSGLTSNSLVIRASDGQYSDTLTIYKVFDGLNGDDGAPAPTAFLTNENITFSANAKGQIAGTTFTTNVVAYMGTTRVTPVIGTINGLPNGITVASTTLNNELILTFTIANNATLGSVANNNGTITIPVTSPINTNLKLNWSKVNSGADGAEGKSGADAYTVVLTNASHTFAGDVANAIANTASTQVIAYKGSASQSVTIVSVNGMNASTNDTTTGIVGLNFKCSTLSGTSPTITFTCTTDFKSASGSIPVVLSVGGLTFTKMFTYSIAFKGEPGEVGPAGTSASSYWLISSANVVQKTSTGTISVTPSTLTFTAKSQTGTKAPIDYAGRWAIAYSNDGISYTNLYVSTTNETSKSITVATTYKAIRARMYLAGGTTTLLDEQIIPIVSDGVKGDQGTPAVSFQIYAPNGYILTKDLSEITLQTFAYEGSTAITSGVTYQWSQFVDGVWTNISGATSTSYTITRTDVLKSKSYRCIMTYKSQAYTSTVTVQDKTDTYNSVMCISSNTTDNNCYWVLYTMVYSDTEEVDPLLGPISTTAPTSPANGDYWYAVDTANATVTLKKYNGSSWDNSTDTQLLSYYWDLINDGSTNVPLGASSKVKVISCHDFTATATLVCEVSNVEDGLLAQSSLSITDASDPIVSETEPTVAVNGQIWIKPNSNGTYLMFVWDASLNNWISSDMDTRNKVYTSRPSSYNVGDLWITASDTDHGTYLHGTLLQAQKTNIVYSASDWSPTLRYDQDIDDMKNTLNNLSQYVTITSAGLRIGARGSSGELSPFTSLFTSTELSFYQNSEKLLTLANNKLTAPRIEVENDLIVQGSIGLGDLRMIIESNGSFSFAVQK